MKYIYTALFTPIEDGSGYYAKVPDLPGCITTGNSLSDAIDQITDAMIAPFEKMFLFQVGWSVLLTSAESTAHKSFRMPYEHFLITPLSHILINIIP